TKKYDKARTPYQRVLESSFIDEQTKEQLRQHYELLNPAQLKRQLERGQRKLLATAARPRRSQRRLATKRRAALRPAVEMPRLPSGGIQMALPCSCVSVSRFCVG